MNCLTNALEEWSKDKSLTILYNGDHAIAIPPSYTIKGTPPFLPLWEYSDTHILNAFNLSTKYTQLLIEYMDTY